MEVHDGPKGLAELADGAQQDDQVGYTYQAIAVEVRGSAIGVTTKEAKEDHQVCGAYDSIS